MGRISREDKTERFDDDVISQAIKLDEDSLTAKYLSILIDAYNGEKIEITDPVLKYAFSLQENRVKKYLEERRRISEQNSENGKKGAMVRWSKQRQQEEDEITFAEEVSQYPFEDFWKLYDMQVGEDSCRMKWSRMRESTKAKIMEHLPKYVASTPNKQYRAEPFNYLSRGYYNNEIIDRTQTNTNSYGSNNGKSYKEAEFERNARTIVENLQAADRGELAYLSPFNKPDGEHQPF